MRSILGHSNPSAIGTDNESVTITTKVYGVLFGKQGKTIISAGDDGLIKI